MPASISATCLFLGMELLIYRFRGKDTREGKMRHSAAGRETGSTASAKHSGNSVGKTNQCCQWQSLSMACCSRLISGLYV